MAEIGDENVATGSEEVNNDGVSVNLDSDDELFPPSAAPAPTVISQIIFQLFQTDFTNMHNRFRCPPKILLKVGAMILHTHEIAFRLRLRKDK